MKLRDDPTIARIRAARHRISEQCGHDPRQVVDYYMELQKKYQGRLLASEPEEVCLGVPTESRPLERRTEVAQATV
jgi:hypothetical protein